MAGCKLVTYDLRKPGKDYNSLINAIKEYGTWAKVCESVWIIKSNNTCVSIRDNLFQYMDSNDKLFVASLTGEAAWKNVICENKWLTDNL